MALLAAFGAWPYTEITCCRCSVRFAMHDDTYALRLKDRKLFYCPNGHDQFFTGEHTDTKRIAELEKQLQSARASAESAQRQREWAESRTKGANIAAGKARAAQARMVARIHAGVCPHCHRTFKQLAAHMKAKHPK